MGRLSAVQAEDSILYWSHSAICELASDAESGTPTVKTITDLSIKSLYNDIPAVARKYSSGAYNGTTGTIMWLYNNALTTTDATFLYSKTNALILDVRLNAFYTYSIGNREVFPYICDLIVTKETLDTITEVSVEDRDDNLVETDVSDLVTADVDVVAATNRQYKFYTVYSFNDQFKATFSDAISPVDAPSKFADWYSTNGEGIYFDCYLLTGYAIPPSSPGGKMQVPYIHVFMERTETGFDDNYDPINASSCHMSSRWDFTDNTIAGKWGAAQQVYRHTRMFLPENLSTFTDGYPLVTTKNKLRGRGRALQLKFEATQGKDMRLLGWSATHVGTT
jgi:hypothetical protein